MKKKNVCHFFFANSELKTLITKDKLSVIRKTNILVILLLHIKDYNTLSHV